MSTNDKAQIDALLVELLRKPEDERGAFLDLVCRNDDDLRHELEGLLAASDEAADFLERPAVQGSDTILTPLREGPGTTIGRYKLLQRIGEGGFGVVYMAEQTEPVKRKVALKIIKLGMDTKQVIARFEAERQALALMEHPNIARVFDAGATETGRPYFVMELVRGVPITEYCDTENLSTQERLELFIQVCHAVQHAHQKGIIHRDIKPSNVMITLHDGEPVPKIIDFGIAKATNRELTDKTLFTEFRQFIGTPAYMSPEQAEMSGLDIDTRSDIYSLGVLLYELLTGTTPFDAARLRSAAFGEIQRIIREVEPPKPSTRLSSLATEPGAQATGSAPPESGPASLAEIAKHRRTDPSALSKLIRGDLDWIVMKALEKNRTRRYGNANEFARDVEHHLAHEPILAGRPGMANKLRKFVKRNRVAVTAGSLVAAALVIGLIVSMVGFVQASRQRDRAIVAEQQQSRERQRAEAAEQEQSRERERAESERDRAVEAKQEARRQAYLGNIAAAQAALSTNTIATVRRRLDEAPSEFRNWEWAYMHAQSDNSLEVLRGHEREVFSVAFSPDGSRIASASADKTVRVWDVVSGKELTVLRGHESLVESVNFSADGTRLVSASWDDSVRLWDVSSGKELAVLRGHEADVFWASFSPDGSRLASGSDDRTIRIWDGSSGRELALLRGHEGDINSVQFSPDGSQLASGSDDKTVRIWDAFTGRELAVLRGHEGGVNSVRFKLDGSRLASGSDDKTVRIWDALSGRELRVLSAHTDRVHAVRFSPDGTRLASASDDKTVRVWSPSTGEQMFVLKADDCYLLELTFSPDGARLASPASDKTVRVWHTGSGKETAVLRGHKEIVDWIAFSPGGTRLASASRDKTLRIWDAEPEHALNILRGHEDFVASVAFSPVGTRVASGGGNNGPMADNSLRLWDSVTGEELAVLRGHDHAITGLAFNPDGTLLASASQDGTVRLWDPATGEELVFFMGYESGLGSVAFSPDGTRVAANPDDNTIRIWEVSTGRELAFLRGHEDVVLHVAFSPDGSVLASGSHWDERVVRLWDTSTGELVRILKGHEHAISTVAFSPNGALLASASFDRTIRFWDTSTGEELSVLRGHDNSVCAAVFSPDGTRLASSSHDLTVRVWDAFTREELIALRGHEGTAVGTKGGYSLCMVVSVAFSGDGTQLASAGVDKTVRIWDSVPYRLRFTERQAMLAARPEAQRIIDELWQQPIDARVIVERLRADASLAEPQRRAALNMLLKRSAELQDQVHDLHVRFVFTDDVVAALEADDSLSSSVRSRAVGIARRKGDQPLRLNRDSWNLVRPSGGTPQAYRLGLRGAEAAVTIEPDNVVFLSTLGMAQYRNRRFEDAFTSLMRCEELRRQRGLERVPRDVAALTMTLFSLGRSGEARVMFEQLEEIVHDEEEAWEEYEVVMALFEEAKQLLEGPHTQAEAAESANGEE